ncbi:MAG: hypothetical protein RRA35_14245 [Desulfomonilia bacterium]|nr:hypothetical protein [Desulfomonilia bacterium]
MTGKRWIPIGMILVLSGLLMGMSGLGSPPQAALDSPFSATIRDTSNNEVSLTAVSIDGKGSFHGFLGKGRVQIPLENISRIEIKDGEACVTLAVTDDLCTLRLGGTSKVYGKTPYGSYQIPIKDIVLIEFIRTDK